MLHTRRTAKPVSLVTLAVRAPSPFPPFFVSAHPIFSLGTFLSSSPSLDLTHTRGHRAGSSPLLPTAVRAFIFIARRLNSALASLVDSHRIDPLYLSDPGCFVGTTHAIMQSAIFVIFSLWSPKVVHSNTHSNFPSFFPIVFPFFPSIFSTDCCKQPWCVGFQFCRPHINCGLSYGQITCCIRDVHLCLVPCDQSSSLSEVSARTLVVLR